MGEIVKDKAGKKVKVDRVSGYLYFTKGDPISIYRVKMQHKGRTKSKQTHVLVTKTSVARTNKYLYYLASDGYLSKSLRKGKK